MSRKAAVGVDDPRSLPDDAGAPEPVPRWVRVGAVAALLLLAVVLVVHQAGGGMGGHG